jgi:hypothetical protein
LSDDYARGDHVHAAALADLSDVASTAPSSGEVLTWSGSEWAPASTAAGTVVGLTDRYEELPSQTFSDFAHASTVAASPTRDIQTAIDATPVGPACQVIVGPGSYAGATVTIPTGRNNISIIGPSAGDFGGTIASLSSSRALTIGNNVVRARIVNLQIEGLTTISTTGSGVHRIERCQLIGGLTLGAISQTVYVVGCDVGNVVVPAGFTGVLLFDRCLFLGTLTNNSGSALRVAISDSAGGFAAPTASATLNGRWQFGASTTFYAGGVALLGAPLTAINSLTPAADRIAYYTSASAGAMTALTPFGRSLIDDVDAATARTTLGLGTAATQNSTAFQASDATLTALAGVTTAANKLAYFTGVDTATVTDITTAGREILSTASSGTNGQVLTSSGGGAPTWTTVSGGSGPWTESGGVVSLVAPATQVSITGTTHALSVSDVVDGEMFYVEPGLYSVNVILPGSGGTVGTVIGPDQLTLNNDEGTGPTNNHAIQLSNQPGTECAVRITVPAAAAIVPTITASDETMALRELDLAVGGLTVNGDAGTSGYVLTSNGTGAAPTWQAAGGGGSPYDADAWDVSWQTADGAPTANGWTLTAGTETSTTVDTVACYQFTPAEGSSSYIQRTLTALNSNFEMRVWLRMPSEGSGISGDYKLVSYYTGATLNKTISLVLTANGLALNTSGTTTAQFPLNLGDLGQQWVAITLRIVVAGNGSTGAVLAWVGDTYAGSLTLAGISQPTQAPNGRIRIGQAENGAGANPAWQIAFFGFRGGHNDAPPTYTYRGTGFGSYGPA